MLAYVSAYRPWSVRRMWKSWRKWRRKSREEEEEEEGGRGGRCGNLVIYRVCILGPQLCLAASTH
jgi:hypothetical protein